MAKLACLTTVFFTTAGTTSWNPPSFQVADVLLIGGGGGGGGGGNGNNPSSGGSGGNPGQVSFIGKISTQAPINITVGAGGIPGTGQTGAGPGGVGGKGGTSSFGTYVATGGYGGAGGINANANNALNQPPLNNYIYNSLFDTAAVFPGLTGAQAQGSGLIAPTNSSNFLVSPTGGGIGGSGGAPVMHLFGTGSGAIANQFLNYATSILTPPSSAVTGVSGLTYAYSYGTGGNGGGTQTLGGNSFDGGNGGSYGGGGGGGAGSGSAIGTPGADGGAGLNGLVMVQLYG